jgi:hypothetical protein
MTENKWNEVVSYVQGRLEKEPEFDVDKEQFYKTFELDAADDIEFLVRRDYPRDKVFEYRTGHFQDRPVLIFSRLN